MTTDLLLDSVCRLDKHESLRIILASQSEIRKKAMKILGLAYECIPSNIDEKAIRDPDPIKKDGVKTGIRVFFIFQKYPNTKPDPVFDPVYCLSSFLLIFNRVSTVQKRCTELPIAPIKSRKIR